MGSLALAVVAVGCGGGSPAPASKSSGDVLQVIQAAASTTSHQKSMHVRGTMSFDIGSAPVSATMDGVMQAKPLIGRMTMSGMSVAGRSVGVITALITPSAIYMKMSMLAAMTGKPWVELKFSELKSMSGFDFSQITSQAEQMQPAQYIAELTSSGDVHVVGRETVNGVQTTHYAGTVSMQDALSHYNAATQAQLKPLLDQAGFKSSVIDVWLDDQGLVRRTKSSAVGGKGSFTFDMDVLGYGVPVDATPPPASQVADLAQLAKSGSMG